MTMRKNKRKKENIKSFEENAEALPIIQDLRFAIIIHNRTDLAESSIHELLQGCKQYSDMGVFFTYFPKLKIHISTEAVLATEYALTKDSFIKYEIETNASLSKIDFTLKEENDKTIQERIRQDWESLEMFISTAHNALKTQRKIKPNIFWPMLDHLRCNIKNDSVQFSFSVVSDSLQPHRL